MLSRFKLRMSIRLASAMARLNRRCYTNLLKRLYDDWAIAVWEIPGADPQVAGAFVHLLDAMRDRKGHRGALEQLLVFRRKAEPQAMYVVGAFNVDRWPAAQTTLNQVAGVTRTFVANPADLVSQALVGNASMLVCHG